MRGTTHAAAGLLAGAVVSEVTGDPSAWIPVVATLGGLLPDIDEPRATVAHLPTKGRNVTRSAIKEVLGEGFFPSLLSGIVRLVTGVMEAALVALSHLVRAVLGHRGATHSLTMALIVTALATGGLILAPSSVEQEWLMWVTEIPPRAGVALGAGYLSHLITDGLTKGGVPLFWPISKDRVRVLPKPLAVRTGGLWDWMVMFLCSAGTAIVLDWV